MAKITMEATYGDRGFPMPEWAEGMHPWVIELRYRGRTMRFPFYMGPALDREPSVEDVTECVFSDCASVDNARDFEDWCADFGSDPDSRKALATFRACEAQRDKLRKLLRDDYDALVYADRI